MSEALKTWRKKLDYLHQQETTVSDPAQKFTLAQQIEEAKAKIAELELATENSSASGGVASSRKVFPTKFTIILPIVLVLLGILAVASFVAFPKKKPDPEIAALKTSVEEMQCKNDCHSRWTPNKSSLGRSPRSFTQFARDYAPLFA